jgi:hypothetical protein
MLGKSVNDKFYDACHDTLDCQLGPMIHIALTPALTPALYRTLDHALLVALDPALYPALYDALLVALDTALYTALRPALAQLEQDLKKC